MACNLTAIGFPTKCNYLAHQWYDKLSKAQKKRIVNQLVEGVRSASKKPTLPEAAAQRPEIDTIAPAIT